MIGHCIRGLALLGKGKEAENVFARVAIMYVARLVLVVVVAFRHHILTFIYMLGH